MERKMSHESKKIIFTALGVWSEFNFYSIIEWELKRHTYYKLFYSWKENVARNVFIIKIISYIKHLQGLFSGLVWRRLISQVKPAVKSNSQIATLAFSESLSSPFLRIFQVYSSYWGKKMQGTKTPSGPKMSAGYQNQDEKAFVLQSYIHFFKFLNFVCALGH